MQNILREKTTLNEKEKEYETLKNMQELIEEQLKELKNEEEILAEMIKEEEAKLNKARQITQNTLTIPEWSPITDILEKSHKSPPSRQLRTNYYHSI